jgi:hypothetical protein
LEERAEAQNRDREAALEEVLHLECLEAGMETPAAEGSTPTASLPSRLRTPQKPPCRCRDRGSARRVPERGNA